MDKEKPQGTLSVTNQARSKFYTLHAELHSTGFAKLSSTTLAPGAMENFLDGRLIALEHPQARILLVAAGVSPSALASLLAL